MRPGVPSNQNRIQSSSTISSAPAPFAVSSKQHPPPANLHLSVLTTSTGTYTVDPSHASMASKATFQQTPHMQQNYRGSDVNWMENQFEKKDVVGKDGRHVIEVAPQEMEDGVSPTALQVSQTEKEIKYLRILIAVLSVALIAVAAFFVTQFV